MILMNIMLCFLVLIMLAMLAVTGISAWYFIKSLSNPSNEQDLAEKYLESDSD